MSHLYRKESDPKIKERFFLILRVKGDSVIPVDLLRNFTEVEHGRQNGLPGMMVMVLWTQR